MFDNKKGQISIFMYIVLTAIIWILFTPLLNAIIEKSAPDMGDATLFFVKLIAWFMLLLLVFSAFKMGKNIFITSGG